MFTGIIQSIGKVVAIRTTDGGKVIRIRALRNINHLAVGESIAVNGVCLTISKVIDNIFEVYVGIRTLSCTNLSKLRVGSKVNLEPALRVGDRVGGHLVQGHVDVVGKVISFRANKLSISMPSNWMRYLVPNGSIAIDGVSLTIANIKDKQFDVSLIPYTIENTTLSNLKVGSLVNLEFDILGKYLISGT